MPELPDLPSGRRHRVLHVAHQCLPHIGGLETVVAAETRGLAGRGWDVALVSSADTVAPGVSREDGIRTVRVRAWNGLEPHGVPFPVFSPWLLVVLWREIRRADVVHVHDLLYLSSWIAALCCVLLRTPYVLHRHVGFVHHSSAFGRLVQRVVIHTIGRLMVRHAALVLPIDDHVAADLRSSFPGARIEVLGNGVDTTAFRPMSEEERLAQRGVLGLPADRPLVLFVGRFVPKKGFQHLVAAASDDYDVVLVGGPPPPGVDDPRLHFLGGRPAAEMPAVYGCADVMVVASVGECPLTVLESMSTGLPLVANDDPALRSPWTAGPGVDFVDVASGDLQQALEQLVSDRDVVRRRGAEARAYVQASFSWDAHVDRLERVYERVLDAARETAVPRSEIPKHLS